MSSIYEIQGRFLTILDMLESSDLDPQMLADTMEGIEGELEAKCENYAMVLKNLEGDIEALDNEIRRLTSRKKTLENNIKRMKEAVRDVMIATGKTKFKTELFSFSVQNNPASVVLDTEDLDTLPDEFIRIKKEVDKAAIKEALLKGDEKLSGYAHIEQGKSLRIR